MKLAIGVIVAVLMPGLQAQQADSPADQYKALLREHQSAMDAYLKAARQAKTNEERDEAFKLYPAAKFAGRFVDLAEKHAKDPVAIDALVWALTRGQGGDSKIQARAVELLRDHVTSEKLGPFCQRAGYSLNKGEESLLRLIAEKNPHAAVQGQALLALGKMLMRMQEAVERAKRQPEMAKSLEFQLGSAQAAKELLARDPKELAKEAEQLFERVAAKFADVKADFRGTLGPVAKAELFSLRHLAIGKVIPDFEGPDQDGKTFKLSDYRGKVVLLDFWQQH